MNKLLSKLAVAVGVITTGIFIVSALVCLSAIPFYLLWNWLMPIIFKLPELTFWQSIGLLALVSIPFQFIKTSSK